MSVEHSAVLAAALDLAWRQWTHLGVSSWADHPQRSTLIHVEPLIVLTAVLGEHDRRLVTQAVDWAVANQELISLQQLNRVVTQHRWPYKGPVARFGATVGRFTRRKWPGVQHERPLFEELPAKASGPDLLLPNLLGLRIRAVFGLGARSEILRHFLFHDWPQTTRTISKETYYGERQVANDVRLLHRAQALQRRDDQRTYRLAGKEGLEAFIGAASARSIPTAALFRVVTAMAELETSERLDEVRNPSAEFARQLRHLAPELDRLDAEDWWRPPMTPALPQVWLDWLAGVLTRL